MMKGDNPLYRDAVAGANLHSPSSADDKNKIPFPSFSFRDGGISDERVIRIVRLFHMSAIISFCIWIVLLLLVYGLAPNSTYEAPFGAEMIAHLISAVVLVVTNCSRIVPIALRRQAGGTNPLKSGFLIATFAVQAIAIVSNFLLAMTPTPIMEDHISGLRFQLIRWVEWAPLSFLMTFLTANITVSDEPFDANHVHFAVPIAIAVSTCMGFLFPLAPNSNAWFAVLFTAWTLFTGIYFVAYSHITEYFKLEKDMDRRLCTVSQVERLDLARASYVLSIACCVTWTLLAGCFTLISVTTKYASPGSWLKNPVLPSILFTFFEIASKVWYLGALIDVYEKVFDEDLRAYRRLEELRNFMSAIWASSSDAIIFCTKINDNQYSARISPAFRKMMGLSASKFGFNEKDDLSFVLEILPRDGYFYIFPTDLSKPITQLDASRIQQRIRNNRHSLIDSDKDSNEERNLARIAVLALESLKAHEVGRGSNNRLVQTLAKMEDGTERKITCEVRVANVMESPGCVLTLRDISDRLRLFESEKKLVQEIAHRKNVEANNFTRHEVKNGILACIGLLEHIRENVMLTQKEAKNKPKPEFQRQKRRHSIGPIEITGIKRRRYSTGDDTFEPLNDLTVEGRMRSLDFMADVCAGESSSQSSYGESMEEAFDELECTLRDIMETILDEAMAREIVYGKYRPRNEPMNVPGVLDSLRRRTSPRFPLTVTPTVFPQLLMDRQLLRYIYRNAVSNACKYGEREGVVETILKYDIKEELLTLEVINAPGTDHENLVNMSPEEVAKVFAPNSQLGTKRVLESMEEQVIRNNSSGNGAWIMQQCATSLGGKCSIRFEATRTVFAFNCRLRPVGFDEGETMDEDFLLPEGTWAIVIDDSRIQRKLMDRFCRLAGIEESRIRILGETAEELCNFGAIVEKIMAENPTDKFLVIVDENLDIAERLETISGSKCVEKLRSQLDSKIEARMLALIRSANDNQRDRDLYKTRAHGFLLKEPIRKDGVLDLIRPWWTARFPSNSSIEHNASFNKSLESDAQVFEIFEEIGEALVVISALAAVTTSARWQPIREKLINLKEDLKTMVPTERLGDILDEIDDLVSNASLPSNFEFAWDDLKLKIESLI